MGTRSIDICVPHVRLRVGNCTRVTRSRVWVPLHTEEKLPSPGVMMPAARGIRTRATDGREVLYLAPRGFSEVLKAPVLTPLRLKVVRAHASRAMLTDVKAPLGGHGPATPILDTPAGMGTREAPVSATIPQAASFSPVFTQVPG